MLDLHLLNGRKLCIPHLPVANDRWLRADQRAPATSFLLNCWILQLLTTSLRGPRWLKLTTRH